VGNFVSKIPAHTLLTQVGIFLPEFMGEFPANSPLKGYSSHPVPGMVINGAAKAFDQNRFSVTTLFYRHDFFHQDVVQAALARGLKGILLWPSHINMAAINELSAAGLQVVLLTKAWELAGSGVFWVNVDTSMAMAQALNHLYDLGHRNIKVVAYPLGANRLQEMEVVDIFCRQKGLGTRNDILFETTTDHYDDLKKLFELQPRPTALILPDEFTACKIFQECYQRNLRVPQNMSIVSLWDNTPHIHPIPLSAPPTVSLFLQSVQMAGQYLIRLLAGEQPLEREINLRCYIQWKASTGPVCCK
jgi:DNA-binding LacI/PurR family transcriptional regulator